MQDGCKVHTDSHMASNESCFILTRTIFQNRLLEVGLTQHRETSALSNLTTVGLLHFKPHMDTNPLELHDLRARDHTTRSWRCVGLSQFDGHGRWVERGVGPNPLTDPNAKYRTSSSSE